VTGSLTMSRKYTYFIILLLVLLSLLAFGQIAGNDFINYDDNRYLTENDRIKSGINFQNIQWAMGSVVEGNWHPLTLISHMLDWRLFGANATGHHLVSLFFHVGACIFLFLFLHNTTKNVWAAAFTAAFLLLHPLRVESVAWAAERKDVLSMFWGMAALLAYSFYAKTPKLSSYIFCMILFCLALMSKPMMVSLPLIMLLLDYWPLRRWQRALDPEEKSVAKRAGQLIGEKIPLFCLSILSCVMTLWAQNKAGYTYFGKTLPWVMRLANAVLSYAVYLLKLFWPADLAVFYPYKLSLPLWQISLSAAIILLMTLIGLYYIKRYPFFFVGWFWYVGALIPVIGLVHVGEQAMADRYTYLPSIGLAIMMAWGVPLFFERKEWRVKILLPAALILIAIFSVLTWKQCGYWKNSETLFSHVLQVTQNNYVAHDHLGCAYLEKGEASKALGHFEKALLLKPNYVEAYYHRGNAYAKLGQFQRAIEDYREALRRKPDFADAYINRGFVYFSAGRHDLAIKDFNKAILFAPDSAVAYYNRGVVYAAIGHQAQAFKDYCRAIDLKPDHVEALYNRGIFYGGQGDYERALEDFNRVIRLRPDFADAYNNRGFTYFQLGRTAEAIEDYSQAIALNGRDGRFYANRSMAYFKKGDDVLGCRDARDACGRGDCGILTAVKKSGLCR